MRISDDTLKGLVHDIENQPNRWDQASQDIIFDLCDARKKIDEFDHLVNDHEASFHDVCDERDSLQSKIRILQSAQAEIMNLLEEVYELVDSKMPHIRIDLKELVKK